jgi:hypothetical protein
MSATLRSKGFPPPEGDKDDESHNNHQTYFA